MTYKIDGKIYELNSEDCAEIRKNKKEFGISEEDAARMFFEDWEYIESGSKVKIEKMRFQGYCHFLTRFFRGG